MIEGRQLQHNAVPRVRYFACRALAVATLLRVRILQALCVRRGRKEQERREGSGMKGKEAWEKEESV